MKLLGNLIGNGDGTSELRSISIEKIATAAETTLSGSLGVGHTGRIIYNTDSDLYKYWDGSAFVVFATGGVDASALETKLNNLITSGGFANADGTFNEAALNTLDNISGLTAGSDLVAALTQLDAAISAAAGVDTLPELTDVTITTAAAGDFIVADGTGNTYVNLNGTAAQQAMGVEIGVDVQAYDADLDALSALAHADGNFIVSNGAAWVVESGATVRTSLDVYSTSEVDGFLGAITLDDLTDAAITTATTGDVLYYDGANFVNAQTGATSGVQAYDAGLDSIAGLTTAADTMIYTTALDTYAITTLTATARSILDDASTADVRTTIGLVAGGTGDIWVEKAGDTMTGALILSGAPTGPNEATTKAYVDALVAAGASWKNPVVDSDLVDVVAVEAATPVATYGLSTGDNVAFIATAGFTTTLGGGTPLVVSAGDIYNLQMVTGSTWDYSLIEAPLTAGDRFIIAAEHGTIGSGLSTLDVNADTFTLANADLIQFTGTGDGSTAASWSTPDGRSGNAGGGTEIEQGVTVLNSDPDSVHYGHTYLYDQVSNAWVEISGPGSIGAGNGLAYAGTTLNINMGAGIVQLPSDEVGIDLYDSVTSALILTSDGSTRGELTGDALHLLLDGSTLIQSATGLKIDAAGVTAVEINSSVAGDGLQGGSGTALSVDAVAAIFGFTTGELDLVDAGVQNVKLANSTITVAGDTGSDTVALGATLTVAGGTGITTSEATGTVSVALDAVASDLNDVPAAVADTVLVRNAGNTAYETQTVSTLLSSGELADLSDVDTTISTAVDGDIMIHDGTNFKPQQAYFLYTSGAASTSHTVTHSLGAQYCNVTVIDSTNEMVIPQSVSFDTANQLTVTFNTSIDCKVVVMGIA